MVGKEPLCVPLGSTEAEQAFTDSEFQAGTPQAPVQHQSLAGLVSLDLISAPSLLP